MNRALLALALTCTVLVGCKSNIDAKVYTVGQDQYFKHDFNDPISNLKMKIDRSEGRIFICFDFDSTRATIPALRRFLIRVFDKNGAYLTHFKTAEYFRLDDTRWMFPTIKLQKHDNCINYPISVRDAAFVEKAEFGMVAN